MRKNIIIAVSLVLVTAVIMWGFQYAVCSELEQIVQAKARYSVVTGCVLDFTGE